MNDGDPLAELRAWRDEFARAHDYDLRAMVTALRELDAAAGQKLVRGAPRRPHTVTPVEATPPNVELPPVAPDRHRS
jgi:hypothetical protein